MAIDKLSDFYELVSDTADLLRDGYMRDHPTPKNLQLPTDANRRTAPIVSSKPADTTATGATGGESRTSSLREIASEVSSCRECPLGMGRTHPVPGEGPSDPVIMVIGEGPGAEEDRTGRPFVGPAGQYLDKWLDAIGLSRDRSCFIANIVKCRPPGNRDPKPDEAESCLPYLDRQIDILRPKAILSVGRIAIQNLLHTTRGIGALRGDTYEYRGVPVIPTYHPSGVLRNPEYRKPVWEDLRRLQQILESTPIDPAAENG